MRIIRNAFGERKLASGDGFYGNDEAEAVGRHLAGVGPFDLTCDVVESFDGDQTSLFSFMRPPTRAYYLPSFMIMSVENFERSDWYPYQVLHTFRYWPLGPHRKTWITELRRLFWRRRDKDFVRNQLYRWFHVGHRPWPNELVGCLTDQEQQAMLVFFEHLEAAHPEEFGEGGLEQRSIAGAKAMVSGGDLASRLAVRGRAECLAMREVLHILCKKYPKYAPAPAEAEEIARELTLAAQRA